MNNFIIPPYVRDSLEDKTTLVNSRKASQFGKEQKILGNSFKRRAYRFILKATRAFAIPTQAE